MYLHTSHHKENIKAVMGESEVERIDGSSNRRIRSREKCVWVGE